jgi:hypothetical protein
MRIEVIQSPPVPSIDGIRLDRFEPGKQYEVGNSIGAVFLAEGWAIPVPLEAPVADTPFDDNDLYDSRPFDINDPSNLERESNQPSLKRDVAADFKWRKRKYRRR